MCVTTVRIRFFFQAEDGIRDIGVTGVQTCALPIFFAKEDATLVEVNPLAKAPDGTVLALDAKVTLDENAAFRQPEHAALRSEERRVGKECRSRWSPYH